MKKIYNLIINITAFIIAIMCLGMLLVAFGIKAIYDCNDDMPLFIHTGFWDVIMLIAVCFMLCLFLKFQDKINRHLSVRYIIAIYIIIAVLFIIYVPLKPFSDMQQIYQGAIEIANGNFKYFDHNAYFMQYPNNMLITLVYGMLFLILPKNYIVLKLLNVWMVIGIIYISEKILQICWKNPYKKIFYIFGLSIVSIFLYINHIYTDLIFIFFSMLGLYLYLKKSDNILYVTMMYSMLYFIRPQAVFYIIAICIQYFMTEKSKISKKGIYMISVVVLFLGCNLVMKYIIEKPLIGDISHSMPAASYVYMAFNEQKFGFQDGSHDINRSFSEVKQRLEGYDVRTVINIILKKLEWTWTEGTYQVQRYAFGGDGDALNKFSYITPLTKYCINSQAKWRLLLNCFMRSQYLIAFALTIPIFRKKRSKALDIFIMLFAANMIFYVFWEIKSRYILPLYPIMLIASFISIENLVKYWKNVLNDRNILIKTINEQVRDFA